VVSASSTAAGGRVTELVEVTHSPGHLLEEQPMNSNLATAKRYLQALESNADGPTLAEFF